MRTPTLTAIALAAALASSADAQLYSVSYPGPALDRWMYPFNFTPGSRASMSCFGALGEPDFDNRDGQALIGFDTGADIPAGEGVSRYTVLSARVRIRNDQHLTFRYDDTYDPYTSYLPTDHPDYTPDTTPGRPLELYGVGYRNGFTDATFLENSPFAATSATRDSRNAFPADYVGGAAVDVSNNVDAAFDTQPFAIGVTDAVAPGQLVPIDSEFVFELDVASPEVQAYLARSLDGGRIRLLMTSLHPAVEMGGEFASFYTKEALFGAGGAARLEIEARIGSGADLNADGVVNGADLGLLLGAWGACPTGCAADLNSDGVVNGADLGLLLGAWGGA